MRTERFNEPQQLGLHKLTGDNSGLVYVNERVEKVVDQETNKERDEYVYDVYEVSDSRNPHQVKNDVINGEHPCGDELKILRKTLRKLMTTEQYNSDQYAEFKAYNEFAESL